MSNKQPDVTIKAKTPEESAALQANMKRWDEEKKRADAMPTPKGFIEVTLPTDKKDKVLIAVRTIGSIRPIDWTETPRASISFKDDFTSSTQPDEQEVLESYDELKRLLAAAY